MSKKIVVSLFLLFFASNVALAADYWIGGTTDWTAGSNWGAGSQPTSTTFVDIRHDAWVANFPVIASGQTATSGEIRMNPGYGAARTVSITVDGGTLNAHKQIYVSNVGGDGDLIINSGEVNVGITANPWVAVGCEGSNGRVFMNGCTFNSGLLGLSQWFGTAGTGQAFISGGVINTTGIIVGSDLANYFEFSKNLADGGGKIVDVMDMDDVDFDSWKTTVADWITDGQITSTVGTIQVDYSSVGETRTTEIYSIPEPMSIALLGSGGLLLRRRKRRK
jgi:hypothetical protein